MSSILNAAFSSGYVSARDPYDFTTGELRRMLGAYYKPGDSRVWKQKGRTEFGTVLADNRVKGLALCQFDAGTDYLVAYAGTALLGATPGTTGTFASLATGLSASGLTLTSTHQDDRWYLGNGVDRNRVLKSDGTVRLHGLTGPTTKPTGVPGAGAGSTASPTANSGGFTNPTFAYDSNDGTFASGTSTAATITHTWSAWGATAAANRALKVKWWLSGLPNPSDSVTTGSIGVGGSTSSGYNVSVKLEKSEDGGTVWSTILLSHFTTPPTGTQNLTSTVTADSSLVQFRATLLYNEGINPATLQIIEVGINTGSSTPAVLVDTAVYYAVVWSNQTDGMTGPPSPPSDVVTLLPGSSHNQVLVTRPGNPEAAATHWILYRVPAGFDPIMVNYGYLDTIPIAETTYLDDISLPLDEQLTPIVPLMTIGDLNIPRDSPPPAAAFMFVHDASVILLREDSPRSISYSEAGLPESFPEFYVMPAVALDEHDRLLNGTSLGRSAVLFAEGAALAFDSLPRVVDGRFDAGQIRPIKGHPGCVGRYAMTPFSVSGEARAAWVSPFGVYQTNGETCQPLSLDLDWKTEVNVEFLSTAVLKWDPDLLVLEFCFDSNGDGANDRTAFIHMSPQHSKENGQPKWSQPTPKATSCIAGGMVGNVYRRYSGHPSDGVVYLEASGWIDEATGAAVAMDVETAKIGSDRVDNNCLKANLLHSDWGTGATGTFDVTAYRDVAGSSQVVSKTVGLTPERGHEIMVARTGEKFSFRFRHSADAGGGLLGVEAELERQGRSVSAPKWQTV